MAKRPVVIATRRQVLEFAGRVGIVFGVAGQGGVQDTDIEAVTRRRRIGRRKIVGHWSWFEALPMNRNADREVIEMDGLRFSIAENMRVLRQCQSARYTVVSIVIAFDDDNANAFLMQARQLISKEHGDLHVGSVVVVK